jgi:hypothetical protein
VELVVDVCAHLRRVRGERRRLEQVAVLGVLVDGDDDPELELFVRLEKMKARTCLARSENSKVGTFCGIAAEITSR